MTKLICVVPRRRILPLCTLLIAIIGLASCSNSTKTQPVTLVSIDVSATVNPVPLGLTAQFTAAGVYSDGSKQNLTNSAFWTSDSPTIMTVSPSGLGTSVAVGSAKITATSGSIAGTATVTISAPALVSLSLSPPLASIAKGLTQQFVATGTFTDKSQQLISNASWKSSDTSVATVSLDGVATGLKVGTTTISATSGSETVSVPLTVLPASLEAILLAPNPGTVPAGLTKQFTASGKYSDGSSQPLTGLVWSTSDSSLAGVDNTGLVTSYHPGSITIIASLGSVQGSAQLNIAAPVLDSISISPASASLQLGSSAGEQFSATGTYSDQSTEDLTTQVTWAANNQFVAKISAEGVASSRRIGFSKVTASFHGVIAQAKLTIVDAPRFLYEVTDYGRDISRLIVHASDGHLQHWGYQSTGVTDNRAPACVVADPSNQFVYVTNVSSALSGGGLMTTVSTYSLDPTTGTLTARGAPYTLPDPISCPRFTPNGLFAYATAGTDDAANQFVTLAKSAAGVLSEIGTTPIADVASGLSIDPLGRFLYVGTQQLSGDEKSFAYGYSINATTGELTPVSGTPVSLPAETGPAFSFSPSGDFLYLSDTNGESIVGYAVNRKDGTISPGAASVTPCINPSALQFTPTGNIAFVTCGESINRDLTSGNLVSFLVGDDGSLAQIKAADAYNLPSSLTIDPSGNYLYVTSSGHTVVSYAIHADGTISELSKTAGRVGEEGLLLIGGVAPVSISTPWVFLTDIFAGDGLEPPTTQLKSFATDLQGSFAFNGESVSTLDLSFSLTGVPWSNELLMAAPKSAPNLQAFAFNAKSTLFQRGSTFGSGEASGGVVMDPSGQVAFASEPSTGQVYWYGYTGSAGHWSSLHDSSNKPLTFTAEAGAGPLAMDPSGRYLFVANQQADSISEFEYAGAAPKPSFPLSASPVAIATDPTGNLLFVAGSDNMLHMLVLNANGDLTDAADVALKGAPKSVVVEPSGHYVYVAGRRGLDAFAIDQLAGTLKAVRLTVDARIPEDSHGIYVEPSGQYLYLIAPGNTYNLDPNAYSVYGLNINSDGTLTPIVTQELAVLYNTTSITFYSTTQ